MKCVNCKKDLIDCDCEMAKLGIEEMGIEIVLLSFEKRAYLNKIVKLQAKVKELEKELQIASLLLWIILKINWRFQG